MGCTMTHAAGATGGVSGGGGGSSSGGGGGGGSSSGGNTSREVPRAQQPTASHMYKYTYFNAMGRGEVARYLFALSATSYHDNRIERADWPAFKPSTPYGQMPVLTYNGVDYCQSDAIVRFLARQFNYYGKTELDGLAIDQILGVLSDFFQELVKVFFLPPGEEKDKAQQQLANELVPKLLNFLHTQLDQNDWFVGNEVTLADAATFSVLAGPVSAQGDGWMAAFPSLGAFVKRFGGLPRIQEYIAKRPRTDF